MFDKLYIERFEGSEKTFPTVADEDIDFNGYDKIFSFLVKDSIYAIYASKESVVNPDIQDMVYRYEFIFLRDSRKVEIKDLFEEIYPAECINITRVNYFSTNCHIDGAPELPFLIFQVDCVDGTSRCFKIMHRGNDTVEIFSASGNFDIEKNLF